MMMRWLGIKLRLVSFTKSTWTGGLKKEMETGDETTRSWGDS